MGKRQPILIVQGGQWGSEAKGAIVDALCRERDVDICIRTGAVNAGHTVVEGTRQFKMQQVPCGFMNKRTMLVIGAGAMIYPSILAAEITMLNDALGEDIRQRLTVDYRAGLHLPYHGDRSKKADRHHMIGATGKGCSEAIVEKISGRGTTGQLFKPWLDAYKGDDLDILRGLHFSDTEQYLNDSVDSGKLLMLEATQGTALDLHLGPYPYTTHKQTLAGQWATEAGLSPALDYEIVLVLRTFPIRVAGDSGPMPRETDWITLARAINHTLVSRGLTPMVREDSIEQYEQALKDVAQHKFGMADWKIEYWEPERRRANKAYVSELHKYALEALPGTVLADLQRLFEMTTVTRKLRRIARFDTDMARMAVRQNRPAYIALTFLNYWYPQFWNETNAKVVLADEQVTEDLAYYENALNTHIKYVTTGPEAKHVLSTEGRFHTANAGR